MTHSPRRNTTPARALLALAGLAFLAPAAPASAQPAPNQPQISAPSRGLPALPDTPAARRAQAWIDALNADDPDLFERVSQEHRTPASLARATPQRRAEQYAQFRSSFGRLEVIRVFEEQDALVVFLHASAAPELLQFRFQIDPDADGRIDAVSIQTGGSPDTYGLAWNNFTDLADLLAQVRRDTSIPALAAAVVRDGQIIDSATVGVRRFGTDQPVGPDARFHWGSVTKGLTATAIASLVEEGVIAWDTTVADVFPDAEILDAYRPITLRQLLSHTAGVPQYTLIDAAAGRRIDAYPGSPVDKRHAFMLDLLSEDPLFAPGEGFRYSNAGYGLAAHMAESVSGIPWETLVQDRVFKPLNMTTAGLGLPSAISDEEPLGHMGAGPNFRPTTGAVPNLPPIWPAGNAHSDIEDLARYAAFHLAGLRGQDGALKAHTIAALHQPAPGTDAAGFEGYACGWAIERWPTPDVVTHAHNGSAGTYYATIRLIPDHNLAIVTLMNAGAPGDDLAPRIERAIYDHFTSVAR